MAEASGSLILEIHHNPDNLKMCLAARSTLADTVRHYSRRTISRQQIAALCRGVIASLERSGGRTDPVELRAHGLMLWDQLLTAQVKSGLKAADGGELVLLLDEELASVPWELVFDGRQFLSLKFSLGRLIATGSRSPATPRKPGSELKMLILADPTADLSRAYQEGVHLRRHCDSLRGKNLSVDFKSTRIDTVFVRKSLREYDVVHFAGHCEREGESGCSGWVLADGMFTCADVLSMAGDLPMPSLIFSNSCHSVDPSDGGLAAAFLLSGVRHFLGPLYKLQDSYGAMFCSEFYTHLFQGAPIGEAVRRARLALIGSQGMDSVSWAQYILYGDPGYVLAVPRAEPAQEKGSRLKRAASAVVLGALCLLLTGGAIARFGPVDRISLHAARCQYRFGRNSETVRLCARVIKGGRFPQARLLMADALHRMGRNDDAIRECFDFMAECQSASPIQSVETYIKIGWLYQENGEYAKARDFYEKALDQSRVAGYKLGESTALRRLAVWHMDKGDDNRALELLTKCLEIDRERAHLTRHRYNLACDYFDMGLCFGNKDENETAKEFYAKSMELLRKMKLVHEESDYYFNVGEIYLAEKQYQKALYNYMMGLKIDLTVDNKPSIAQDYIMLGELYVEMECQDKAEEFFLKALAIAKQIHYPSAIASASFNLGVLYRKKRSKMAAREYLRQAQEIYRFMGTPELQDVKEELEALDD